MILFEIPFTQKNLFFNVWAQKSDIASLRKRSISGLKTEIVHGEKKLHEKATISCWCFNSVYNNLTEDEQSILFETFETKQVLLRANTHKKEILFTHGCTCNFTLFMYSFFLIITIFNSFF